MDAPPAPPAAAAAALPSIVPLSSAGPFVCSARLCPPRVVPQLPLHPPVGSVPAVPTLKQLLHVGSSVRRSRFGFAGGRVFLRERDTARCCVQVSLGNCGSLTAAANIC